MADRLLMIYNADAGLVNGAMDLLHKMLRPETYACRLCGVTYGLTGMKRAWARTVAALPYPVEFLHRDEWALTVQDRDIALPAIVLERDGALDMLVSAEDFDSIETLTALQALLSARLGLEGKALGQR